MLKQNLSPANADSAPVIALHCSGAGAGQWRHLASFIHGMVWGEAVNGDEGVGLA